MNGIPASPAQLRPSWLRGPPRAEPSHAASQRPSPLAAEIATPSPTQEDLKRVWRIAPRDPTRAKMGVLSQGSGSFNSFYIQLCSWIPKKRSTSSRCRHEHGPQKPTLERNASTRNCGKKLQYVFLGDGPAPPGAKHGDFRHGRGKGRQNIKQKVRNTAKFYILCSAAVTDPENMYNDALFTCREQGLRQPNLDDIRTI